MLYEVITDGYGMSTPELSSVHRLVWCALLAALVAVGAFLQIPIGPVPFTLQSYNFV